MFYLQLYIIAHEFTFIYTCYNYCLQPPPPNMDFLILYIFIQNNFILIEIAISTLI